jgi:hypothetical protein
VTRPDLPELLTPDALRAFAEECLRNSTAHIYMPYAPTPPAAPPGFVAATMPSPLPDPRPTAIAFLLQGLLAMQLAESITHTIEEHP